MEKLDNTFEKRRNNADIYLRETIIFYTWANKAKNKIKEVDNIKDLDKVRNYFENMLSAFNNIENIHPNFLDRKDVNSVIDEKSDDRFEIARFLPGQTLLNKWGEMNDWIGDISHEIKWLQSSLYTGSVIQEIEEKESKVSIKEVEKSLMVDNKDLNDLRKKIKETTDALFGSLSEDEKKIKIEIEVVVLLKLIKKFDKQITRACSFLWGDDDKFREAIYMQDKNIKIFFERLNKKNGEAKERKENAEIVERAKNELRDLEYGTIISFADKNIKMSGSCSFVKGGGDKYYGYNSIFTLDELVGYDDDKEVNLRTFYFTVDRSDTGEKRGIEEIEGYYKKKKDKIDQMKRTIGI